MAKLTTLEIFNKILRTIGEATVDSLTSLTGLQNTVWDKLIEALHEICTDQNTRWQFLESEGRVPLTTGDYKYLISGLASGADMLREDRESFRFATSGQRIKYYTPQEWDKMYPQGITASMTGVPTGYTKFGGYLVFNRRASSTENGDYVDFRYWRKATEPVAASPSATLDIPDPFDRLVLCPMAAMKVMVYLESTEASAQKLMVYGDPAQRDIEGNLPKLHEIYGSPEIKPRVSFNA